MRWRAEKGDVLGWTLSKYARFNNFFHTNKFSCCGGFHQRKNHNHLVQAQITIEESVSERDKKSPQSPLESKEAST